MFLVLVGFMGCGKSSLMRHWKDQFDGPCGDLDELIAFRAGVNPQELGEWIRQVGFGDFRKVEAELLKKLLNEHDDYILSLGGGAFHKKNQELITQKKGSAALWIETPVDTCWHRVKDDPNRPLVSHGEVSFKKLYQERVPDYRQAKYRLLGDEPWPALDEFCKKYNLPLGKSS